MGAFLSQLLNSGTSLHLPPCSRPPARLPNVPYRLDDLTRPLTHTAPPTPTPCNLQDSPSCVMLQEPAGKRASSYEHNTQKYEPALRITFGRNAGVASKHARNKMSENNKRNRKSTTAIRVPYLRLHVRISQGGTASPIVPPTELLLRFTDASFQGNPTTRFSLCRSARQTGQA